ncbi:hypothetical protein J0H33_05815 [bacterium]|nr:hypothetical protein [bacterium]
MNKNTKLYLFGAGLAVLTALAVACGGDDDTDATPTRSVADGGSATSITVNLKNWAVEPSSATVKAGTVSFRATHEEEAHGGHGAGEAGATHQLVVARLQDGADVGETKFGAPVLNLADIKVGEEKTGEAVLEPGRYELSCLVVDGDDVNHYEEGMYALLTVE